MNTALAKRNRSYHRHSVGLAVTVVLTLTALSTSRAGEPTDTKEWIPVGQLDPTRVSEASGMVKSRRYPGIFWTHGDSGNQPELYAFRESGELVKTVRVSKAPNTDWEDLALDDQGNLYIGDIGNNKSVFPARYVYVLPEPDPAPEAPSTAQWTKRWKFKYPEKRFNAECLFVLNGRMFITSTGLPGRPTLYRLDPVSEQECELVAIGSLSVWGAQGADVSVDGHRLVVCTSGALWVIPIDENATPIPDRRPQRVRFPQSPVEACCFDGDDVLLLSEHGQIHRVTKADIDAGTRFVQPNTATAPQKKPTR